MYRWSRVATAVGVCVTLLIASGCAAPPNREIGDAQQALNRAKGAGAEQYASESYTAAADAYRLANEAVMAGDYRLALNRALESREHAQTATREATDAKAKARDDVLQLMADVEMLMAQANTQVEAAERARQPAGVVRDVRQALTLITADVQKASAAIENEDFLQARSTLTEVQGRIDAAMVALETAKKTQRPRRPRS
jgi:hypothetical protein